MRRNRFALALGAIALTFSLTACEGQSEVVAAPVAAIETAAPTTVAAQQPAAEKPTAPAPATEISSFKMSALPGREGLSAEETAEAFYIWYPEALEASFRSGVRLDDEAIAESGYLTQELWARIAAEQEAMHGGPGGADLILCAQDVPRAVEVTLDEAEGDRARLTLTSDLIGHRLGLEMVRDGEVWQIAAIHCAVGQPTQGEPIKPPSGEPVEPPSGGAAPVDLAPAREGWQVYASAKYGYDLSYPTDWTHHEHVSDPNQPPLGPEQLEMMALIMPQAWADAMAQRQGPPDPNAPVIAPFTLEVVRGDAEALRQVYAPPTESEPIALGGHAATRDVEQITNEISLIRYVVQHPSKADLWLVFTDSISGFPDRLPDNEATVALFEEILQTLRFN